MSRQYTSIGTVRMGLKVGGATKVFFVPDGNYSVKREGGTYAVFVVFVESDNGSSDYLMARLVKCDPEKECCVELRSPHSALHDAVLDAAVNHKKVEIYIDKDRYKKNSGGGSKPGATKWLLTGITIPAPTNEK